MSVNVRIEEVMEALEHPEDWECYLDRSTGKVITITENEAPYLERDGEITQEDIEDLPEWQRNGILEVRRALGLADLIPLPSKYDLHEWEIMKRFSILQPEPVRSELLDAIHGAGAFRTFRRTVDHFELREEWFSYRDAAIRQFAREWLEENEIPFTE